MATFISNSPAETESLGEAWGRTVTRGTVFALIGDLGAGKTQLVRGLARGLGAAARVHSPTFAIVNLYDDGRLPLAHLDLYRLETPQQLLAAGVEEFLQPEGVAVIEWAEKLFHAGPNGSPAIVQQAHPPRNLRPVRIEILDENIRRLTYEDSGA
ncbi:MAG: tRNA (adenosine(37)-N6)-threonylcarbamoyltransferase complex ATPase subunit type 1 TsaE [Verrucomicrobia bacterium]|jgi:tRNA threonylcarbamoyladenosine biosynthesis protein TsaE|nr:tRNA (adenosine(37)-N6)-threonylcarbamoyltransferase complex ATPase subunit type 1 TsaE [Verrucomicrobiota bacterium]